MDNGVKQKKVKKEIQEWANIKSRKKIITREKNGIKLLHTVNSPDD